VAFLLVSLALSIAVLAKRNLYDDEISSLARITTSASEIVRFSSEGDLHPPGMYLLAHFAYGILPSFRWINLFPCLLLYAGLAVFLFRVTPLFARTRSQLCLLLLTTLHPQLFLWSATFRWYGWWTGLALIAVTVALQPRETTPSLGPARGLILGLLLACLFYLNYITFLFAFALAAAMILRYRTEPWKRMLIPSLIAVGVFFALLAPQLHTMLTVHLPESQSQRSGLATSSLRLLQSIATSEAYLPWHPLAILAGLMFLALCLCGLIALIRLQRDRKSPSPNAPPLNSALMSIVGFGLLFFLLIAITRLGGKPRSGLLLIPVLAVAAAWIVGTLRPRTQSLVLIFFAIWSAVGLEHLLGRHGLAKASMNDRPEQVVAFVRSADTGCSVVVTYDPPLAFWFAQADLPRTLIISPFLEPTFGGSLRLPDHNCEHTTLYAVQSYLGANGEREQSLNAQLRSSVQSIEGPPHSRFFSFDPDAGRKRSLAHTPILGGDLASASLLPDYRYVVVFGPIDRSQIDTMRQRMPDFLSGTDPSLEQAPGPLSPSN
jgi:hypothetical protein